MTELEETEDTLFHALGFLEDLNRKKERTEDRHLKWVGGLGISLTFLVSSGLLSLWDPQVFPVIIFSGPILLVISGICLFGARKEKKNLRINRGSVGELGYVLWEAEEDAKMLLSPILNSMFITRLSRIGGKKDFPSRFSSY